MPEHRPPTETIDDTKICTLAELCEACNVEQEWVVDLVQHGALEPLGRTAVDWQFTSLAIVRVSRAKRLTRDLDLNASGVALALELLDEVEMLRSRLKALETRR